MNRWLQPLQTGYHRLTAWRYRTMAAFLRHDAPPADDRHGLVIVQIDGLSYSHLREALAVGAMPTLRRLALHEGWRVVPWLCGLPSTTPSVQAGIMYGYRWDIPSFRWYEKETHLAVDAKAAGMAARLNERIAAGREGLLTGGSSYSNIHDGGAALTFMTFSAFSRRRFFENARGLDMLLLFLLNPLRALRVGLASLWDVAADIAYQIAQRLRSRDGPSFSLVSPLAETLIGVALQEIQTFGTRVDMHVGQPVIYVNYLGYDELAHRFGPLHPQAMHGLRRIDRHIAEIIRTRHESASRPYRVIILSDHGQSPSISFRHRYGQTLGEFIQAEVQDDVALEDDAWSPDTALDTALLLDELDGVAANLSPRMQRVMRLLRRSLEPTLPPLRPLEWRPERHGDVVVQSAGPVSHIYFNVTPRPMNLSEVAALYPTLLAKLVSHPGIGLVLGREGAEPAIVGPQGIRSLARDDLFGPGARLAGLGEGHYVAAQLRRLMQYPHSGDLVLVGAWNAEGQCVAFEDHRGTHGGLSGEQDQPFLVLPPDVPLPELPIEDAEALYGYFRSLTRPGAGAIQTASAGQAAMPDALATG